MQKFIFNVKYRLEWLTEAKPHDGILGAYETRTYEVEAEDGTSPEMAAEWLKNAMALVSESKVVAVTGKLPPKITGITQDWYASLPYGEPFKTSQALMEAELRGIPKRTAEALLADNRLFKRHRQGRYMRKHK